MKQKNKVAATTNWPLTILLIVGCLTVIFPLYDDRDRIQAAQRDDKQHLRDLIPSEELEP